MTNQNDLAEELMRRIEKEEERVAYTEPERKTYHLCIVNLVIGTLYCAKQNYEFGISRIMKSLEPFEKKVCFVLKKEDKVLNEFAAGHRHLVLHKEMLFELCR